MICWYPFLEIISKALLKRSGFMNQKLHATTRRRGEIKKSVVFVVVPAGPLKECINKGGNGTRFRKNNESA